MIAGLAKAITLYLAPVLMLTALILSLLAYLAPVLLLQDRVSLLSVTPSTALLQAGSSHEVDGPSIFLGLLGSCSRPSNAGHINCTVPSVSPQYDLSTLPDGVSQLLLSAPTTSTPVFTAIAISFSVIFMITFTLISFRHKLGAKLSAMLEKPLIQRLSAWLGFFGFFIGITSFLIVRMWFGKAVNDFNGSIILNGSKGTNEPELVANVGNGFTMAWVAYAFYAVPVIVSMAKMNASFAK